LEQFINEARTLAQFDHPNVVRVKTFFKGFNTAYMVMDYYDGMSLNEYMSSKGNVLSESITLGIMLPILDGLHEVHNKGFLHRDIKPHNIFLTSTKRVILLDFGAARVSMNERSKSMSVVLTPGFAPPEQYHGKGKQGPWTDIYAVAATMMYMLTGAVPAEATERLYEDQLPKVKEMNPDVSQAVSEALHHAMAIRAEDRPQTVPEFQALLAGKAVPPKTAPAPAAAPVPPMEATHVPPTIQVAKKAPSSGGSGKWIGIAAAVVVIAAGGWFFTRDSGETPVDEPVAQADAPYQTLLDQGQREFDAGAFTDALASWKAAGALRPDSTQHVPLITMAQDSVTAVNARQVAGARPTPTVRDQPRTQTQEPAARPAPATVVPFSYRNDFNGSTSDFPARSTGNVRVSFSGGRLRYQQTQTGNMGRTTPSHTINLSADMTMETAAKFVDSSQPSQQIGLVFGDGSSGFHFFGLDNEGDLFVSKNSGGTWSMLLNFTKSSAVRRGNLMNTFKIEKRGTRYTFYLNNTQVHQQTISSLDGNSFGIGVSGVSTAEFDYFQLTGTQP
jgi:hypothetical protein